MFLSSFNRWGNQDQRNSSWSSVSQLVSGKSRIQSSAHFITKPIVLITLLSWCWSWSSNTLTTWCKDSVQFSSVTQSCPTLCHPMNSSMPGLPVQHQLPESKLMSIESVMPSSHLILCHPLLLLPPNPPQHQGLLQWVNSSHQVAKVLEFQLQHESVQWTPRTDLL